MIARVVLLSAFIVFNGFCTYSQEQSRIVKDARNLVSYIDNSAINITEMFVDSMSRKDDAYTETFYKSEQTNSLVKVEVYNPIEKSLITFYFQSERLIFVKGNDTSGTVPLLIEIVFRNEQLVYESYSGSHGSKNRTERLINKSKSYLLRYKLFHKMPH